MTKGKSKPPKQVTLSDLEANELKERIKQNELTGRDIDTLLGLIAFNLWVQERLARAKLTIKRLRQLFGFKSESRKKSKKSDDADKQGDADEPVDPDADDQSENNEPVPGESADQNNAAITVPLWDPAQNHGRFSAGDYSGCPIVDVPFENPLLKEGKCPQCDECDTDAIVYTEQPTLLVFLHTQ